ncbi:hypothetical protein D3C87_918860 [compost metagenome]
MSEEVIDQLRIALDPQAGIGRIEDRGQTLGEQGFRALDQRLRTDNRRQRIMLELTQADTEQALGFK